MKKFSMKQDFLPASTTRQFWRPPRGNRPSSNRSNPLFCPDVWHIARMLLSKASDPRRRRLTDAASHPAQSKCYILERWNVTGKLRVLAFSLALGPETEVRENHKPLLQFLLVNPFADREMPKGHLHNGCARQSTESLVDRASPAEGPRPLSRAGFSKQ